MDQGEKTKMICYQVQIIIDNARAEKYLEYMKKTHIEDMLKTGCFMDRVDLSQDLMFESEVRTF
jgi:hypothetical protein